MKDKQVWDQDSCSGKRGLGGRLTTKEARFSLGFASSCLSSLMSWYATLAGMVLSGILQTDVGSLEGLQMKLEIARERSQAANTDFGSQIWGHPIVTCPWGWQC